MTAPQQARSRESLRKIFEAAEEILKRKDFDDVAVAEIASEAGVSIGSFYSRFDSKNALLSALLEDYERDQSKIVSEAFDEARRSERKLAARLQISIGAIVLLFRKRRGVFRSLVMRHWRQPLYATRQTRERVETIVNQFQALLLDARREIRHPHPEAAVKVAVSAALAICRETIVLRPKTLPGSLTIADDELTREVARMLHAYLTTRPDSELAR